MKSHLIELSTRKYNYSPWEQLSRIGAIFCSLTKVLEDIQENIV
jgi:hypothetical protein